MANLFLGVAVVSAVGIALSLYHLLLINSFQAQLLHARVAHFLFSNDYAVGRWGSSMEVFRVIAIGDLVMVALVGCSDYEVVSDYRGLRPLTPGAAQLLGVAQ